jgi:hypothetical protein
MIHFHLAQLEESPGKRYRIASSTLVYVEGYRGSLVEEGEWLALQLSDVFLLRWPDTEAYSGLKRCLFKCPPPQKILPGIESTLIGRGKVYWWDSTYQGYDERVQRFFNHLSFPEHTFEESLSKNIKNIKRLSNAIYVTGKAIK